MVRTLSRLSHLLWDGPCDGSWLPESGDSSTRAQELFQSLNGFQARLHIRITEGGCLKSDSWPVRKSGPEWFLKAPRREALIQWVKHKSLSQMALESREPWHYCDWPRAYFLASLVFPSVKGVWHLHCGRGRALDTEHADCLAEFLVLTMLQVLAVIHTNQKKANENSLREPDRDHAFTQVSFHGSESVGFLAFWLNCIMLV